MSGKGRGHDKAVQNEPALLCRKVHTIHPWRSWAAFGSGKLLKTGPGWPDVTDYCHSCSHFDLAHLKHTVLKSQKPRLHRSHLSPHWFGRRSGTKCYYNEQQADNQSFVWVSVWVSLLILNHLRWPAKIKKPPPHCRHTIFQPHSFACAVVAVPHHGHGKEGGREPWFGWFEGPRGLEASTSTDEKSQTTTGDGLGTRNYDPWWWTTKKKSRMNLGVQWVASNLLTWILIAVHTSEGYHSGSWSFSPRIAMWSKWGVCRT